MIKGIILGGTGLVVTGIMMVFWAPDAWWKEVIVLSVFGSSVFLAMAWTTGRKKWGIVAAIGVLGLLILNRFGILNGATAGGWLILWILISLMN